MINLVYTYFNLKNYTTNTSKELIELISDAKAKTHCLLDIDEFGRFNNIYGRVCGDNLLETLLQIINSKLSPLHLHYIGSDEFYFSFVDEVDKKCFAFLKFIEMQLGITVSIGVVKLTKGIRPDALLYQLKSNVALAKSSGKNLICIL